MPQVAIAVDITECECGVNELLSLIPFGVTKYDYWQAILDVWLANYAANGVDFNQTIYDQATRILAYRSESLSEAEDNIARLMTLHKNQAIYINNADELVTLRHSRFSSTHRGYGNDPVDIVLNMVTASLRLACSKAWWALDGGLHLYSANLTPISSIELMILNKGLLIFHIEV